MQRLVCLVALAFSLATLADDDGELPFPRTAEEADALMKTGTLPDPKDFKSRTVFVGKGWHYLTGSPVPEIYQLSLVEASGEKGSVQHWFGFSQTYPKVQTTRQAFESDTKYVVNYYPASENDFVEIPRPEFTDFVHQTPFRIVKNKKGQDRILELIVCATEKGCEYPSKYCEEVCGTNFFGKKVNCTTVTRTRWVTAPYLATMGWALYPVESAEFISVNPPDKPKPKPPVPPVKPQPYYSTTTPVVY